MEYLLQRIHAQEVFDILTYSASRSDELFISGGSFYTITFLIEKYLRKDVQLSGAMKMEKLRQILTGVLNSFQILNAVTDDFCCSVNDTNFLDLEDSYQGHIAEVQGCDVLLTINKKHFAGFAQSSSMSILTPSEFINKYLVTLTS